MRSLEHQTREILIIRTSASSSSTSRQVDRAQHDEWDVAFYDQINASQRSFSMSLLLGEGGGIGRAHDCTLQKRHRTYVDDDDDHDNDDGDDNDNDDKQAGPRCSIRDTAKLRKSVCASDSSRELNGQN